MSIEYSINDSLETVQISCLEYQNNPIEKINTYLHSNINQIFYAILFFPRIVWKQEKSRNRKIRIYESAAGLVLAFFPQYLPILRK